MCIHIYVTYKPIKGRGNSWISGKETVKSMVTKGTVYKPYKPMKSCTTLVINKKYKFKTLN